MKGKLKVRVGSEEMKNILPILQVYHEQLENIERKIDRFSRPWWKKLRDWDRK